MLDFQEECYAGDAEEHGATRAAFLERRANAYQAYWESMPLRRAARPSGSRMQLYRRFRYGRMAEFHVLDTRQYRSDQPCGGNTSAPCAGVKDPQAAMLGAAQERWLLDGLRRSEVRWNVIPQQVMMTRMDRQAGPEVAVSMDQWSGYDVPRDRLLRAIHRQRTQNLVVLTGDIHSNWVGDLRTTYDRPEAALVGTEFVGTSISSGGDGVDQRPEAVAALPENPQIKFYNAQRGYVRCTVGVKRWTADYRVLEYVTKPGSPVMTRATFVVEPGRPGAQPA